MIIECQNNIFIQVNDDKSFRIWLQNPESGGVEQDAANEWETTISSKEAQQLGMELVRDDALLWSISDRARDLRLQLHYLGEREDWSEKLDQDAIEDAMRRLASTVTRETEQKVTDFIQGCLV